MVMRPSSSFMLASRLAGRWAGLASSCHSGRCAAPAGAEYLELDQQHAAVAEYQRGPVALVHGAVEDHHAIVAQQRGFWPITLPSEGEPFSSSESSRTLMSTAGSAPAALSASTAAGNITMGPLSSEDERANSRHSGSTRSP